MWNHSFFNFIRVSVLTDDEMRVSSESSVRKEDLYDQINVDTQNVEIRILTRAKTDFSI